MLDGPEQRRLSEIEQALEEEEPKLARSMRAAASREFGGVRTRRWCTAAAVVALFMLVVSLLVGNPGGAFLCAVGAVAAVVARRRLSGPGSEPPQG